MEYSTILSALVGQTITPDEVRSAALQLMSFAPLLPAIVLTIMAVSGGRHRRSAWRGGRRGSLVEGR